MAGVDELDKFVRKFVCLWQSGWEANLQVQAKAGNAFVSLHLGLGQAEPNLGKGPHYASGQGSRGGSPAKQRRKARREDERKARKAAEQVDASEVNSQDTTELTAVKVELDNVEEVTEEVNLNEVVKVENQEYELKVAAHQKCKNYDIIECIEVNFDGALDDLNVEKNDRLRFIDVHKKESEEIIDETESNLFNYRVVVRDLDQAKSVVESWKEKSKFDDLAFKNAEYGKVRVRILEVNKV